MAFEDSVKSGHKFENQIADYLKDYYSIRTTQNDGKNSKGDIYLTPIPGITGPIPHDGDGEFLCECKQDCSTWETGYTVHEIYRFTREGVYIPAGLSITEAKYYIFGYSHWPSVYFIETEKLIRMKELNMHVDVKDFTGDGAKDSSVMRFIPRELHRYSNFLFKRDMTINIKY